MNDFSELEKELRKLRPTQPSPVLFERVGEALKDGRARIRERRSLARRWGGLEASHPWWSLGFGLAAAAVLVLFAAVTMERRHEHQQTVAQSSPAPETTIGSARDGTIDTSQQVRSCRWDKSRLQHPRRRIAFC